nr:phenylalanine--tRNA ligase subunit alpha [Salinibacterium sp.]
MSASHPITEENVAAAVDAALAAIDSASDSATLKQVRSTHLGEASALSKLNAAMRDVPKDEKATTGQLIGKARGTVNQAFTAREAEIVAAEETAKLAAEAVDVTALATRWTPGARHPLTLLQEHMSDIFVGMGWEVAEGPELENEWFNFDAMNFDEDHPARAMQDTFFVEPADAHLVLRTHTSPVQIRSLLD